MLDSYVDSAPSALGDSLQYRLPAASDAIGNRREAVYFPQGGDLYSSTGVRECSFRIGSDSAMLDVSAGVFIKFRISNLDTVHANTLNLPAYGVWSRLNLRAAGTEVEDINFLNRTTTMMLALADPHVKENLDTAAGHIGEQIAAGGHSIVGHKIFCVF